MKMVSVIYGEGPEAAAPSLAASVSSWATEGVGALAANGIMKGSGNALLPKDPCTIEQSILLVYRIYTMSGVS